MDEKYIQQLYQDLVRRYGANHMIDYDTFSKRISTDGDFQKQTYSEFQKQYGADKILSFDDFSTRVKKKDGGSISQNGLQNQSIPTQNINPDATLKLSDTQAQQQNSNGYTQKPLIDDDRGYTKYADSVLKENEGKNFVQRYLHPDKFPTLQTNKIQGKDESGKEYSSQPDSEYSTHLMSYDPKSKRVYPEVVQLPNGQLKHLSGDEAWDYADKTGEFIQFKTAEEAKKFADNGYKRGNQFIKQSSSQNDVDVNALNAKHGQIAAQNNELGQYGANVQQATQEKKKQDTDNAINNTAMQWAENQPKLTGVNPKLAGTKLQELQKNSLFQSKVAELSNSVKNGDLEVSGDKLARPMSTWQNLSQGWSDANKTKKEADNFWGANKEERIKMLNQKQPDEGYLPLKPDTEGLSYSMSSAAPGISKMVGGGVVGSVAALALAPFTGGTSLEGLPIFASLLFSGDDMARTGFHAGLQKYYQRAKQENPNISDSAAYDKAYNMAVAGEAESLGTGIGLTAIGGNSLPQGSGQGLLKTTGQFLLKQSQIISEVGALSGLGSFGKDLIARSKGFKVSGGEMSDNITESMKQMAVMQLAFNIGFGAINSPKYLKAQANEVLAKANPEMVQQLTEQGLKDGTLTPEQADKANRDLADYQAAKNKTIPTGDEEKDAVITGLIQKKNNLEKAKENVDKSYHKELDAQIETAEQKIQAAKNSDNPTFVETDDLTGEHNLNPKEYDKLTAQEKDGIEVNEDYGKSETEQIGKDEEKKFKPVAYYYEEKGGLKLKHEIEVGEKSYNDKSKAQEVADRALKKHFYENGLHGIDKPQKNERSNTTPEEKATEETKEPNIQTNEGSAISNEPVSTETGGIAEGKISEVGKGTPEKISKFPKPEIPIQEMNSEQLYDHAKKVKTYLKNQEVEFFGEEGAKKYKEAQRISNSHTASYDERKAADKTIRDMEGSLTEQQRNEFNGIGFDENGIYDHAEINDLAGKVNLIEQAENVNDIARSLKLPLLEFSRNGKPSTESLTLLNAAKNKASELGISPQDLIKESLNNIARDLPDKTDASFLAKTILDKLIKPNEGKLLPKSHEKELSNLKSKHEEELHEASKPVIEMDRIKNKEFAGIDDADKIKITKEKHADIFRRKKILEKLIDCL